MMTQSTQGDLRSNRYTYYTIASSVGAIEGDSPEGGGFDSAHHKGEPPSCLVVGLLVNLAFGDCDPFGHTQT